jgi:microsomal epoxide hydrolase
MHGWPGSHFEHLDLFDLYRKKYSPDDLPYHTIAVSLPGWTLSSGPPLDRDFDTEDIARLMNKFMIGLGFGSGYICQGGDIGSFTAKVMAGTYDECKGAFNQVHSTYRASEMRHWLLTDAFLPHSCTL